MTEEAPASDDRAAGARILVVDDEVYMCQIISRWLDAEGHRCATASGGQEALGLLESGHFELMVTDIMMPGISGITLMTTARERFPDLAVIMVTAVDDRKTAGEALALGAYGYVIKPFEQNEVLISVANALERRRLVLESRDSERRLERKVQEQTAEIRASREEIAMRLIAAQGYRSDETGAHIRRMGLYAEMIGKRLGYSVEDTDLMRLSAPMHDVGKIGIPDSILLKPGKLDREEFEIMKTHTTIGAAILGRSNMPLIAMSRVIALGHHEKWDGSGYPKGLRGKDIAAPARIVAVLDVYDALAHDRVYRPAVPEEEALEIIAEGKGKHFDPQAVEVFQASLDDLHRIQEEVRREE